MIANIVTAANLGCGIVSTLLCLNGTHQAAAWLIVLAAVLDAMDGKFARFFGSASPFGIQFDSMADMVSFGVAPAVLAYSSSLASWNTAGLLASCVPVIFVAIRLARFNTEADERAHDFSGLSAPLQACLTATFVIMSYALWGRVAEPVVLLLLILMSSVLMVTPFPMPGLPRLTWRETGFNQAKLLFLLALLLIAAADPPILAFPVFTVIVISGFGAGFIRWVSDRDERNADFDEPTEPVTIYRGQS